MVAGANFGEGLFQLLGKMPEESIHQLGDVLAALAQRRDFNLESPHPEIKVLTQTSIAHGKGREAVAGGDEAEIHRQVLRGAQRTILALLQNPQETALQFDRHLRDLVEKKRPAIRLGQHARKCRDSPGERAFRVAEQFRLDHVCREGAAVELHHADHRPLSLRRCNLAGENLLADSALAGEQDIRIAGSHAGDELLDLAHAWRLMATGASVAPRPCAGVSEVAPSPGGDFPPAFCQDPACSNARVQRLEELLDRIRLCQGEMEGAYLDRLRSHFWLQGIVRGENHDRQRRMLRLDFRNTPSPSGVGKAEVEQHKVADLLPPLFLCLCAPLAPIWTM